MSLRNDKHSMLRQAERRVSAMDTVEGFRNRYLATILSALESGLDSLEQGLEDRPSPLYDAFVMLRDVVEGRDPMTLQTEEMLREPLEAIVEKVVKLFEADRE